MARREQDYSEDMFADTRMSFGEHLEELRIHLWKGIYGFLIALCFSFFSGKRVLHFISKPVEDQLRAFYDERVKEVANALKQEDPELSAVNTPQDVEVAIRPQDLAPALRALGVQIPENPE